MKRPEAGSWWRCPATGELSRVADVHGHGDDRAVRLSDGTRWHAGAFAEQWEPDGGIMETYDIDPEEVHLDDLPGALRTIAESAGIETALRVAADFGGGWLYIPKMTTFQRKVRNRRIFREFDGANHHDLARRHRLSVPEIYRILRIGKKND